MEYTHIYIYTHEQSQKKSDKNKVQQIDPENNGNQKLYLPVKKKTKKFAEREKIDMQS